MRYTGHIEVTFEYDVPGDTPGDHYFDRNIATAGGSADTIQSVLGIIATNELAAALVQFDNGVVKSWGVPEAKTEAA